MRVSRLNPNAVHLARRVAGPVACVPRSRKGVRDLSEVTSREFGRPLLRNGLGVHVLSFGAFLNAAGKTGAISQNPRPTWECKQKARYNSFSTFFIPPKCFIVIRIASKQHPRRLTETLTSHRTMTVERAPGNAPAQLSSPTTVTDAFENLSPFSNSVVTNLMESRSYPICIPLPPSFAVRPTQTLHVS
jgi:hypothetical protein